MAAVPVPQLGFPTTIRPVLRLPPSWLPPAPVMNPDIPPQPIEVPPAPEATPIPLTPPTQDQ